MGPVRAFAFFLPDFFRFAAGRSAAAFAASRDRFREGTSFAARYPARAQATRPMTTANAAATRK